MDSAIKWKPVRKMRKSDNILSSKWRETGHFGFTPSYFSVARTNMNFLMSNEYMRMWFKEKEIYERNTYSIEQIIKDESKIKRRYVQRMMTYKKPTKNDFNKEMKDRPKYNNPMKVDYSKYKCKPECPKLKIDGNIEAHSSKVLVRENEINDAICKIKILPCDCHNTEKYK